MFPSTGCQRRRRRLQRKSQKGLIRRNRIAPPYGGGDGTSRGEPGKKHAFPAASRARAKTIEKLLSPHSVSSFHALLLFVCSSALIIGKNVLLDHKTLVSQR